jgi:hypothetical protein
MSDDPIVDEIRKFRDEYAAKFNYDLKAIVNDLKRKEKESGVRTVSRPPHRVTPVPPIDHLQPQPTHNDVNTSH